MAVVLRALVVTTGMLVSPITAHDSTPQSRFQKGLVDSIVFATPLPKFMAMVASPTRNKSLDWESDGCSVPIIRSTGRTFDFTSSCQRHDFAYRNYKRIDSGIYWSEALRQRIDSRFSIDMRDTCKIRARLEKLTCTAWAHIFYRTVRTYAGA